MKDTLGEIQNKFNQKQMEILEACEKGGNGYKLVHMNTPPYCTAGLKHIEHAPNWNPDLKKLALYIKQQIKKGEVELPITKETSIKQHVRVLDVGGVIEVELYVTDRGIECEYKNYSKYDVEHKILATTDLDKIDPFYVFNDMKEEDFLKWQVEQTSKE